MNKKEYLVIKELISHATFIFISEEASSQDLLDIIKSQLDFWEELEEYINTRQPTQHGGELVKNDGLSSTLGSPAEVLNSKEQKTCETGISCKECEIKDCGCRE